MYHPVMYFVYHIILFNGTLYHLPMCTLIMFLWHPHHVPMAASSYSYGPLIIFLNSNSTSSCSYGTHHVHCARTFILKPSFYSMARINVLIHPQLVIYCTLTSPSYEFHNNFHLLPHYLNHVSHKAHSVHHCLIRFITALQSRQYGNISL